MSHSRYNQDISPSYVVSLPAATQASIGPGEPGERADSGAAIGERSACIAGGGGSLRPECLGGGEARGAEGGQEPGGGQFQALPDGWIVLD